MFLLLCYVIVTKHKANVLITGDRSKDRILEKERTLDRLRRKRKTWQMQRVFVFLVGFNLLAGN